MPYKDTDIKIKTRGEKGTFFEDNYKRDFTEASKKGHGNSYLNGHLKSSISFNPPEVNILLIR